MPPTPVLQGLPGPYANNNQVKTLNTNKKTIISISANGYSDEKKSTQIETIIGTIVIVIVEYPWLFTVLRPMASRFKKFSKDEIWAINEAVAQNKIPRKR